MVTSRQTNSLVVIVIPSFVHAIDNDDSGEYYGNDNQRDFDGNEVRDAQLDEEAADSEDDDILDDPSEQAAIHVRIVVPLVQPISVSSGHALHLLLRFCAILLPAILRNRIAWDVDVRAAHGLVAPAVPFLGAGGTPAAEELQIRAGIHTLKN